MGHDKSTVLYFVFVPRSFVDHAADSGRLEDITATVSEAVDFTEMRKRDPLGVQG